MSFEAVHGMGRSAADGLDALMASCAMELNVSALFLHDGVFIVKRGTGSRTIQYGRLANYAAVL